MGFRLPDLILRRTDAGDQAADLTLAFGDVQVVDGFLTGQMKLNNAIDAPGRQPV